MPDACPKPSPDRLTSLVDAHAAGVLRYLRVLTGDAELARDLAQETFLKLETHAETAGSGLVFTVARSCALESVQLTWRRFYVKGERFPLEIVYTID